MAVFKSSKDLAKDLEDYDDEEYDDIDEDYERSFGPVNTKEKRKQYIKWKKECK